jgi:nicotinamide mononucleotide transporter
VKGYVFTSVQFFVLLMLAIAGLIEWRKKAQLA